MEKVDLDDIIARMLEKRNSAPGTKVNLKLHEVKYLIEKSREIFISQPVLLDLEAPLKIVGDIHGQYWDLLRLLNTEDFHQMPIISFWELMSIADLTVWKRFVFYSPTKSNTRKIFLCSVEITSAVP